MFSIPRVSSIREKPDLDLMGRKMDLDHKPQVEKYLSCLGMSLLPRKEDQGLEREVRDTHIERNKAEIPIRNSNSNPMRLALKTKGAFF